MSKVTKIDLSRLKRCGQVWDDMPESEQGRLCLKCNNTIIDFRDLTDSEIAHIHLFSGQKVCGLYTEEQLQVPVRKNKNKKLSKWKSIYIGFFSLLTVNGFSQEEAGVKTEQIEKAYDAPNKAMQNRTKEGRHSALRDSVFITGTLTNQENEPVIFGNVVVKGTKIGASTDFNGFYSLNITELLDSFTNITLRCVYLGYETVEKEISLDSLKSEENRSINMQFEGESSGIDSFVVTPEAPDRKGIWYKIKSAWYRTRNIFRKKR